MGPGAHNPYKEFGEEIHHKMHFGGKYKWKPDSNPPPGMYEPKSDFVKSKAPSVRMNDKSLRSDFTKQAMDENPSGGNY